METLPLIIPIDSLFHTPAGDWKVEMPEEPRDFSEDTCIRYKYKFLKTDHEGRVIDERHITLMVPKSELKDEHRDEEIRGFVRDRLSYTSEPDSVLNPYGCELEPPAK